MDQKQVSSCYFSGFLLIVLFAAFQIRKYKDTQLRTAFISFVNVSAQFCYQMFILYQKLLARGLNNTLKQYLRLTQTTLINLPLFICPSAHLNIFK